MDSFNEHTLPPVHVSLAGWFQWEPKDSTTKDPHSSLNSMSLATKVFHSTKLKLLSHFQLQREPVEICYEVGSKKVTFNVFDCDYDAE